MKLSDLTPEQARRLLAAVKPMMAYTGCLARRMQAERWDPTDSFYVQAHRADDALHVMRMLAHYAVCGARCAARAVASNRSRFFFEFFERNGP